MPFALFAGFILVPVLEIYVVVRVAQVIHVWPTVFLLVAESVFGAWLVKREGRRAWRALRQAIGTGKLPSRQLADAALVLAGGTLLLTPGFLTDIVGVPWDEVQQVGIYQGRVLVARGGKWLRWGNYPVKKVPNVHVFLELGRRFRASAASHSSLSP